MSDKQKQALKMMSERRIGALRVGYNWIWPVDIRENEETAKIVINELNRRN